MQKKTVKYYCDDCGKEVDVRDITSFSLLVDINIHELRDICKYCILKRINHSLSIVPLNRICKECKGKGRQKEFYGYHNEYHWIPCDTCKGKGYMSL